MNFSGSAAEWWVKCGMQKEYTFSSLPSGIVNVTVGREFSDHCLVYFNITSPLVTSEEPPRKIHVYGRGNYDQFRTDIHANFRHRFFAFSADREINDNWSLSDSDTFTILSSRLDCYKFSFFPRTISEWNKLSQDVRSKSSIVSFLSALLPGPVENNF